MRLPQDRRHELMLRAPFRTELADGIDDRVDFAPQPGLSGRQGGGDVSEGSGANHDEVEVAGRAKGARGGRSVD
jgi:hypothetical protein